MMTWWPLMALPRASVCTAAAREGQSPAQKTYRCDSTSLSGDQAGTSNSCLGTQESICLSCCPLLLKDGEMYI